MGRASGVWLAAAIIVGITLARLVYVAFLSPYTLVEDEAWYWEWSRRLEWSYTTKGPGVAWLIAASVAGFRQIGMETNEFVVRFPAVLSGAILMLATAGLTRDITRNDRIMVLAVLGIALAPVFQAMSLLMTIDAPFMACWALAAWAGWRALRDRGRWAWIALGAALGAGFLFKYTILLLLPGLVVFALVWRQQLRPAVHWQRWLCAGAGIFALGLLPVIIWNAQHNWATARHLLGHLGLPGGDVPPVQASGQGWSYDPGWTLELIGAQAALIGPLIALMVWGSVRGLREQSDQRLDRIFLIACALPILVFYIMVTLLTRAQANWPVAGFITLFPLAAWVIVSAFHDLRTGQRQRLRLARGLWAASIGFGLMTGLLSLRLDLVAIATPLRSLERAAQANGFIPQDRTLVPLGRLMGADTMARDVERLVTELRQDLQQEPFVISQHYGRASLLAFYMHGRPTVYCSSAYGGGRKTQYDLWEQTNLEDMIKLENRPAVLIGGSREHWERAFASVHEYGTLAGETKPDRLTWLGTGYLGFDHAQTKRAKESP